MAHLMQSISNGLETMFQFEFMPRSGINKYQKHVHFIAAETDGWAMKGVR